MTATATTRRTCAYSGSYEQAVEALFARRPQFMLPGLERIRALCTSLGEPQAAFPAIHITGTNGKTSIARMITALLVAHGLRVGTYTSPHLQDVRERIRLQDEPIDRASFLAGLQALGPHLDAVEIEHGHMVTFFETMTGLALQTFATGAVDVAVVEVGIGGRSDATNVIDGRVAVINRVALGHPQLGGTVEEAAWEKAGIVKQGATVVSAEQDPGAARVIAAAAANHARLAVAGRQFMLVSQRDLPAGQDVVVQGCAGRSYSFYLPLLGAHQASNAACALAAAEAFLGADLDPGRVREGFAGARSPGRLEVIERPAAPPVVLDGAHNPDGARALAAALRAEYADRRRVLVLGVLADRGVEGVLTELLPVADRLVVTQAPCSRAAAAEELAITAARLGWRVDTAADVASALELATSLAAVDDVIIVAGSLYTVGAARHALRVPLA